MIVKNEAQNLPRCLDSLQLLLDEDNVELIIVDTGSEDNTIEIAKKYTDKVFFHAWNNNFSDMRNKSISYATGEWVFIIDADEELINANKLCELLRDKTIDEYNAIRIPVVNILSKENNSNAITKSERIFRSENFKYRGSVHNQPVYKGPILYIRDISLMHYGYINEDQKLMEKKFKRTSSLLIDELKKDPQNIYYRFQLARSYFMHKDYVDGLKEIRQAYALLKKSKDKKKNLSYIFIFNEYVRMASTCKKYDEAIDICLEGISINNNLIDFHFYLAKCYAALGKKNKEYNAYKTYLDIYTKIKENKLNDNYVELYTLDKDHKYEALFKMAHYYYDKKKYEEAYEYLEQVKNNKPKILLSIKILIDSKQYDKLLKFYYSISDEKLKTDFLIFLENRLNHLAKNEKKEVYGYFSLGEEEYAYLNKIRTESSEKVSVEQCKRFITKFNLNKLPSFYNEIFHILIRHKTSFLYYLKHIQKSRVKKIVQELIESNEDMQILLTDYITQNNIQNNDYYANKLYTCIAYVVLVLNLGDAQNSDSDDIFDENNIRLFDSYVDYGINYICNLYQVERLRLMYQSLEVIEDKFFIGLYLAKENEKIKNHTAALGYYKEAINICPHFAKFIKRYVDRLL